MKLSRTRVALAASSAIVVAGVTVLVSELLLATEHGHGGGQKVHRNPPAATTAVAPPGAVQTSCDRSREPSATLDAVSSVERADGTFRRVLDGATDALRRPGSTYERARALRALAVAATIDPAARDTDRKRAVAVGLEALALDPAESDPELSLAASGLLEQLSASLTHADVVSTLLVARTPTSRVVLVRLLGLSAAHDDRATAQLRHLAVKDPEADVRAEALACLLEVRPDEDLCRDAIDEFCKSRAYALERALSSTRCSTLDEAMSRRFAVARDRAELDRLARVLMARGRRQELEPYAVGPEPWAGAALNALEDR